MNCEAGDIARVTRGPNRDRLVRVLQRCAVHIEFALGEPCWDCENLQWMEDTTSGARMPPGSIGYCEDAWLRPIRDPGEDARDETLTWRDVPKTTRTPETTA
jgi:hypothetical protein